MSGPAMKDTALEKRHPLERSPGTLAIGNAELRERPPRRSLVNIDIGFEAATGLTPV
jgi:hypothetical protein